MWTRLVGGQAARTFPHVSRKQLAALFGASTLGAVAAAGAVASAEDEELHPPHYPWGHQWKNFATGFDHYALRRGFQVYQQVCSTCHSLNNIAYRHFVGVFMNDAETRAMVEELDFEDGPDDTGEMFERPGKLGDYLPKPYPNEEAARFANSGALPPDLTLIVRAREGNEDYVFSLLNGYYDPPAGVELRDGLYYNIYFPGNAIGMTAPLHTDGQVEYDDGTEATVSQMAKDVVTFLSWTASPDLDERKKMGIKFLSLLGFTVFFSSYYNRFKWQIFKNQRVTFLDTTRTRHS
eukprot:Rmarinus@m.25753